MKKLVVASFIVLLAACASDPAKREEVATAEAARMRTTEAPLSHYGRFELRPIETSPAVAEKEDKVAVAQALGQKLDARLRPLLAEWESKAAPEAKERVLVITPTVASVRVVSGGARFFAGGFAGDSHIDLDIALVDKASGRMIANQRINRNANALAGAWSVGASDRNLADYIVDIAHKYLSDNYADR